MAGSKGPALQRLIPPVLLFGLLFLAWRTADFAAPYWVPMSARMVETVALALLWLAAGWLVVRLLDAVFWSTLFPRRVGHPAPRLLTDLVAALVWIAIVATIGMHTRGQVLRLRLAGVLLAVIGLPCLAFGIELHVGVALWAGFARGWMYFNAYEGLGALLLALAVCAFELSNRLSAGISQPTEPTA